MLELNDNLLNTLCKPISEQQTCGTDLRLDHSPQSLYYQIKDARAMARQIERSNVVDDLNDSPLKHWQQVNEFAIKILSDSSKDLEICAWFVEALLRTHQLAGLHFGFTLIEKLLNNYHESLLPSIDEDGIPGKLAALTGLNGYDSEGTLINAIRNIHLTNPEVSIPFALWQYQQALDIERISDATQRQKRIDDGATVLSDIQRAVDESSTEFYQTLFNQAQHAVADIEKLTATYDRIYTNDAPPTSQIKTSLQDYQDALLQLAKDKIQIQQEANVDTESDEQAITNKQSNQVSTREQALNQLIEVASYFRRHEPHSPIPYLLERAVKWGRLALPDLLQELVASDEERNQIFHLAGIGNNPQH